ncbi:hypothetical protein F3Y22_tig00110946pilonHSYRG00042 [Hibiscus syriacus]|uniref:DUF7950 domain-containing protein n=1 Tax=Hibiscus syriacus TaxID=106335 RepID=A0A6A2ZAB1_HIBSY|nr:uncharacterized protein LOC120148047 [Hibiscus syriacus]KAE8688944.1 hypothetical protein F3Y22_tig00110946pilonHSYRG00042 [Hibiscus syriacus]
MESRGGCCLVNRYEAFGVYDMSKVDRIMLRFRPIAPKPANGGGGGSVSPLESSGEGNCKLGRGLHFHGEDDETTTLWLSIVEADKKLSFSFLGGDSGDDSVHRAVRSSCVTLECVTDTWVSGDGLGCTDEERKVNLGKDTCPGFISDLFGRVIWTNGAYKEMVGGERWKDINSLTVPCDVWRMNGGGFAWRLDINAALCLGR